MQTVSKKVFWSFLKMSFCAFSHHFLMVKGAKVKLYFLVSNTHKPVLCWKSFAVELDGCWPLVGNRGRIPISAVHDWCLGPMFVIRSASGGVCEKDRWGIVFSWLGEWSVPGKVLTWGMLLGEVTKGWWEGFTLTNTGELDSPSRIWVTSSEPPRRWDRPVNGSESLGGEHYEMLEIFNPSIWLSNWHKYFFSTRYFGAHSFVVFFSNNKKLKLSNISML